MKLTSIDIHRGRIKSGVTLKGQSNKSLFRRHRWSYFNFAWQCSGVHIQKIGDYLANVFRLYLPGIRITGNMIIKICSHRTRHNGSNLNTIFPQVKHNCLGKTYQSKFTGIVSSAILKEVSASETGDSNDISF